MVNHCDLVATMKRGGMDGDDFREAVMERAGEIVAACGDPKAKNVPHKLRGVEIVATALATHVIRAGAAKIADDFDVSLSDLEDLASEQHISFC